MPLITATVVKEETSSKLGIAFERIAEDRAMTIKLIRDDSLFKGSELVEGLIVSSAAGKDMEGMSPKDCADALRDAPGGEEISLVCKGAVVTVKKAKKKKAGKPHIPDIVAVKVIDKSKVEDMNDIQREIDIMQIIEHNNVIRRAVAPSPAPFFSSCRMVYAPLAFGGGSYRRA